MTSSGQIAGLDVVVGGNRSAPDVANYGEGALLEIDRNAMPVPNPFMTQPMSIFHFARITFLVSGAIAFAATVAAAVHPGVDPARFVASIYADGREGVVWAEWLERAARGMVFALADGAMGAVRRPRSQEGRRTRRSRFRRCDEFPRAGGQEIYGQDALARRLACERCREARARQLGA